VSGASVLLAPEMQELMRLMQSPSIDGVVAREFSRLMRPENFADYALLQVFSDSKTSYIFRGSHRSSSKTRATYGNHSSRHGGNGADRNSGTGVERKRGKETTRRIGSEPNCVGVRNRIRERAGVFYTSDAERVRAAFQQFLAGAQSYKKLAEMVGVTPVACT